MVCNIKKFREEGKLTQTEVAEAVGVTVGAVSQWESGRCLPNAVALMRLSKLFDVSPEEIIEEDGENVHLGLAARIGSASEPEAAPQQG